MIEINREIDYEGFYRECKQLDNDKNKKMDWVYLGNKYGFNTPESARQRWKKYRERHGMLPKREEKRNDELESKISKIEMEQISLKKERIKLQDKTREFNKLVREDARFEMFLEELQYNINTLEAPKFSEYTCANGKRIGVLGIADIHYGKIFNSINNSYSIDICLQRMNALLNEAIDWIADRDLSYLHIVNCSDNVEGMIRISQLKVLEIGVIDSVIEFSKMMSEWLNHLSKYIPFTYHHIISANHSEVRFFNQKAGQFPDEDLEKIIANTIAISLKDNPRINVPIYKNDYALFKVFDKNIFACHGHQFRNKKPADIIKDLQMLHGIKIDVLIMGHKHHEEIITVGESDLGNIKVILLPAVMGSDSFSDEILTGSCAGASFIEFNEGKKGLTISEVILD